MISENPFWNDIILTHFETLSRIRCSSYATWNFRKKTRERNRITWLGRFLKLFQMTLILNNFSQGEIDGAKQKLTYVSYSTWKFIVFEEFKNIWHGVWLKKIHFFSWSSELINSYGWSYLNIKRLRAQSS